MNEPEKSDKPVVPMKSANSGTSLNFWEFIEHLEGMGLAKENEDHIGNETGVVLQAGPAKQTDRTLSRLEESVITLDEGLHSALDRVRQAACRDKSLKFTSLWHHVYNIRETVKRASHWQGLEASRQRLKKRSRVTRPHTSGLL